MSRLLDKASETSYEDPMNTYKYSEDPRDTSIPVSAIVCYTYCPRRCYIQYKLGVKGYPTLNQLKGLITHKILSRLFVEEPRIATLTKPDNFYQTYIDYGLKIGYDELQALSRRKALSNGWRWLIDYVKRIVYGRAIFLSSSKIEPGSHRMVNIALRDHNLRLKGILDGVDEYRPVEFKSKYRNVYPHKIQVALYSILLERAEDVYVDEAYMYYAESSSMVKVRLIDKLRFEALSLVEKVRDMLENDKPPARISCIPRFCPVHPICYTLA